jgi:putative heme-binding domain-containing protein
MKKRTEILTAHWLMLGLLAVLLDPCRSAADEGKGLPICAPDWKVEVVSTAPRILHPTAIACSPDGRVFACEDNMDMPGPVDRPVNRILCFHPNGRVTVFADKVHAAFSMEYIDGKLYVHHCPNFSVFSDGGEVGEDRVDLIATTNPAPWGSSARGKNQINDHIPAGFQLAMDGYLYIAVGDKGIHGFVGRDRRPLELPLGGVVRMRLEGTGAEVYATGFRTVLNPAIDARGEIFLYDNNDHLNIHKTAVVHVVDGGYYGYPWDDRPPRPGFVLPMDVRVYEAGAPTGVLAYEEDALPESYRGNLLLCDWGRGELVRLGVARRGAGYETVSEEKLLAGNIRPTGIAVSPDGMSLYVGDWQFPGWREDVQVGRLLKLTYRGRSAAAPKPPWYLPAAMGMPFEATTDEFVRGLSHPARGVRMVAQRRLAERGRAVVPPLARLLGDPAAPRHARWHALWTLDAIDGGVAAREAILEAVGDRDASVAIQAIRQLGTRRVADARGCLLARVEDPDAAVRFQVVTALGRIGAAGSVAAVRERLADGDRLTRYAAFTALNRIGRVDPSTWDGIVEGLASDRSLVREGTQFALRETYEAPLVGALTRLAGRSALTGQTRAAAYRALFALHRRTPEWDGLWWRLGPLGYLEDARDARPRLPKTREWTGTAAVTEALHAALDDPDPLVRRAAVEDATIELDRGTIDRLVRLFDDPASVEDRPAILLVLGSVRRPEAAGPILAVLRRHSDDARLLMPAIAAARQQGGPAAEEALVRLAGAEIPPSTLAAALRALGELEVVAAVPVFRERLAHREAGVRAAAVAALARIGNDPAVEALISSLGDPDLAVRRDVVGVLGTLRAKAAVPQLLRAYQVPETRSEAIAALARIPDRRALDAYLEGLGGKDPSVRDECRKALAVIREEVRPLIREKLALGTLPAQVVLELGSVYGGDRGLAPLIESVRGRTKPEEYAAFSLANRGDARRGRALFDDPRGVGCNKCHRVNGAGGEGGPDLSHVAANYGRAELTEAVLFPSKKVADGFRLTTLALASGEVLSGVVVEETGERLSLVDSRGTRHALRKSDIEERTQGDSSPMPEGLQAGLTTQEFADLVAYLETLK